MRYRVPSSHVLFAHIVLTVFIALAPTPANAQTLTGGVKAGINFASLPNAGTVLDQVVRQGSTESSSKAGLVVGGFVNVPWMGRWVLQPELQFVAKGVQLTEAAGGTLSASIRYLEFPVLVRYGFQTGSYPVYLLAGPTFAVKAGTGASLEATDPSVDVNIDGAIRTFDAGIAFAAGVDYQRFFVEARYTQGLRDVATESFPHVDALKNRAIAVVAGIRLK